MAVALKRAGIDSFTVFEVWPQPRRLNLSRLRTSHGRRQLASHLVFGLAFGLAIGLASWVAMGFTVFVGWFAAVLTAWFLFGFLPAFVFGLGSGLMGGLAGIRYIAPLLCTRRWNTYWLPWRLGRFLDVCYEAGLIRIAGSGYQFRHREVQDYLAGHQVP